MTPLHEIPKTTSRPGVFTNPQIFRHGGEEGVCEVQEVVGQRTIVHDGPLLLLCFIRLFSSF